MTSPGQSIFGKRSLQIPVLLFLFCTAFAIPIYFGTSLVSANISDDSSNDDSKLFADALLADSAGNYISIAHSDSLLPDGNGTFVVLFWLRPKKPPLPGETSFVLQKIDQRGNTRYGYAFGYTRDESQVYPVAFWSDRQGKAELFRFAKISLIPKVWQMLAFYYIDGRFLGAHYAPGILNQEKGQSLLKLGGYDLGEIGPAYARSELSYGSRKNAEFRGQLGPLGIFSLGKNSIKLDELLKRAASSPLEISEFLKPEEILLFTEEGITDLSSTAHKLESRGGILGKRKDKGKAQRSE